MGRHKKYGVKTRSIRGRIEYYWAEIIKSLSKIDVRYSSESDIVRKALLYYLLNVVPKELLIEAYKYSLKIETIKSEDIEQILQLELNMKENMETHSLKTR